MFFCNPKDETPLLYYVVTHKAIQIEISFTVHYTFDKAAYKINSFILF